MKLLALMLTALLASACLEAEKSNSNRPPVASPGVIAGGNAVLRSQLHRSRETAILTTAQEAGTANRLPVGYDNIPNIFESDDGLGSSTRTVIHASHSGRPCGQGAAFATIQARIQDCATINGSLAGWNGQSFGNAGEGNWVLVVRNSINDEVWLDQTTDYLWSDRIAEATSWCEASGNTQGIADGGSVDCQVLNPNLRNLCSNVISILPEAQVLWRLPTRPDFLQADVNGARYVLRNTDLAYWTATVSGANRDEAWSIEQLTGVASTVSRASGRAVRCIGRRQ